MNGTSCLEIKNYPFKADDFQKFIEISCLKHIEGKRSNGEDPLFIFDNARIHTASKVKRFLQEEGLKAFTLCPYSPELS